MTPSSARFCGPATTVTVPYTSPPRLRVKTMNQVVSFTGECYAANITLFPEQVKLLHSAPPLLFLSGPPGTGKTLMMLLMGKIWLLYGKTVHVVSTWKKSRAACYMMHDLLQKFVKVPGDKNRIVMYDFTNEEDVNKAVNELSEEAKKDGSLYIIADEAGPDVW